MLGPPLLLNDLGPFRTGFSSLILLFFRCFFRLALGASELCPVKALRNMLAWTFTFPDQPLFQVSTSRGCFTLIDSMSRKHLNKVSTLLGTAKHFTFYDFRRGGPLGHFLNWSCGAFPGPGHLVLHLSSAAHSYVSSTWLNLLVVWV